MMRRPHHSCPENHAAVAAPWNNPRQFSQRTKLPCFAGLAAGFHDEVARFLAAMSPQVGLLWIFLQGLWQFNCLHERAFQLYGGQPWAGLVRKLPNRTAPVVVTCKRLNLWTPEYSQPSQPTPLPALRRRECVKRWRCTASHPQQRRRSASGKRPRCPPVKTFGH